MPRSMAPTDTGLSSQENQRGTGYDAGEEVGSKSVSSHGETHVVNQRLPASSPQHREDRSQCVQIALVGDGHVGYRIPANMLQSMNLHPAHNLARQHREGFQ